MSEYIERETLLRHAIALNNPHELGENVVPVSDIEAAPAVDAVPVVHAQWKHSASNDRAYDYCSACRCGTMRRTYGYNPDGREYVTEQSYSFCPRCGARMDEKEP